MNLEPMRSSSATMLFNSSSLKDELPKLGENPKFGWLPAIFTPLGKSTQGCQEFSIEKNECLEPC